MDPIVKSKYENLFMKYPVAISHLHQQFMDKRLGLVLGAGVSKNIGFPDWKELIRRIANSDRVNGASLFSDFSEQPVTSQMLFQLFKKNFLSGESEIESYNEYGDVDLRKEWNLLVHDILYNNVSSEPDDWVLACPYLKNLNRCYK